MSRTLLPLRIEWTVVTPWCPPAQGLHLDGLIAHALVENAKTAGQTIESFDPFLADLPFGRYETEAGWVWQASLVRPDRVLASERRYMTAKTAAGDFAHRMMKGDIEGKPLSTIDTVRGPYKNDAFWYTIEHINRLVAWCIGDPERIAPLLDAITHIGKRARLDHGRIDPTKTTIVEDHDASSKWRHRHMPTQDNGHVPAVGRLRPPYWMGEGAQMVWRPN